MNKTILSVSVAWLLALASGAALADEKTYDLSDFTGVSVSAGIDVEINVGGGFSVRAEGSAEGLEKLDVKVKAGVLDIGRKNMGFSFGRSTQVTVYVSLPALSSLDASSGADANATGISGDAFAIDASSGADATVVGACGKIEVDASSGAQIEAGELKCKDASVDASSGANATIFASESVTADASSGGHVTVLGAPKSVNTDSSSGGSVKVVK